MTVMDDDGWQSTAPRRKKKSAERDDGTPQIEKPSHLKIMRGYRVQMCKDKEQGICELDDKLCFNAHSPALLRRCPYLNPDDVLPNAYCGNKCKDLPNCPRGNACWYTHNDSEYNYHPAHYKTRVCTFSTSSSTGYCERNGKYCPFAHGENDLRQARHATTETLASAVHAAAPPAPAGGAHGSGGHQHHHGHHHHHRDTDGFNTGEFNYETYKTIPCEKRACACDGYHNPKERRRHPLHYWYATAPCPYVFNAAAADSGQRKGAWSDPSECPRGDKCDLAHTVEEQMYHPEKYKTVRCQRETTGCQWGARCSYRHSNEPPFNRESYVAVMGSLPPEDAPKAAAPAGAAPPPAAVPSARAGRGKTAAAGAASTAASSVASTPPADALGADADTKALGISFVEDPFSYMSSTAIALPTFVPAAPSSGAGASTTTNGYAAKPGAAQSTTTTPTSGLPGLFGFSLDSLASNLLAGTARSGAGNGTSGGSGAAVGGSSLWSPYGSTGVDSLAGASSYLSDRSGETSTTNPSSPSTAVAALVNTVAAAPPAAFAATLAAGPASTPSPARPPAGRGRGRGQAAGTAAGPGAGAPAPAAPALSNLNDLLDNFADTMQAQAAAEGGAVAAPPAEPAAAYVNGDGGAAALPPALADLTLETMPPIILDGRRYTLPPRGAANEAEALRELLFVLNRRRLRLEQQVMCPVCLDRERNSAFYPCGHVICNDCERKIRQHTDPTPNGNSHHGSCPQCRQPYFSVLPVYL